MSLVRALLITSPEPLGVSDPPSPSEPSEPPTLLGALSQSHRPPPLSPSEPSELSPLFRASSVVVLAPSCLAAARAAAWSASQTP